MRRKLLYPYCHLELMRDQAKESLHLEDVAGVYQRAKEKVLQQDHELAELGREKVWEKEFEPSLFWSKFARSFMLPFLLIFLVAEMPQFSWSWRWPIFGWLSHLGFGADFARARVKLEFLFRCPVIPAVICAGSFFVYVALRLAHMEKLYQHVSKTPPPLAT